MECDEEWAMNKKVVDLSSKDIRHAVRSLLSFSISCALSRLTCYLFNLLISSLLNVCLMPLRFLEVCHTLLLTLDFREDLLM